MKSLLLTMRSWSPVVVLLALGALGCGPYDPEEPKLVSYGAATDPLPEGATLISYENLKGFFDNQQLRGIRPGQEPHVLPSGVPTSEGPTFRFKNKLGEVQEVKMLSAATRDATIADAKQSYPSRENQVELYRALTDRMRDSANPGQSNAAAPESLETSELMRRNDTLAAQWPLFSAAIKRKTPTAGPMLGAVSSGASAECALEQGFSTTGGDRVGANDTCAIYEEGGLQSLYSYPAKEFQTCVKNQGRRGTCVVFGTTSNIEMAILQKYSKRVNLSEQDLYFRSKAFWGFEVSNFGDGLWPSSTYASMISNDYSLSFESTWSYNASYSRATDTPLTVYTKSCVGYGEACSDTSHQGAFYCAVDGPFLYCGYYSPALPEGSGYRVKSTVEIWNADDTGKSLDKVRAMLISGTPLELAFSVTNDFYSYTTNGYASFTAGVDLESLGGHAVHIVGFITNENLATLNPEAPAGAGGGYLIVKNSWGNCWGDGGYVYLPFDLVKKNAWSIVALTAIE